MNNQETATRFLQMCAKGDVRAAYARHVAEHFVYHNAWFPGDRESLLRETVREARKMGAARVAVHTRECLPEDAAAGKSVTTSVVDFVALLKKSLAGKQGTPSAKAVAKTRGAAPPASKVAKPRAPRKRAADSKR